MQTKKEFQLFNSLFAGLGVVLLGVASWIGLSVAHLPAIEQKLDDFVMLATGELQDHEARIRLLEKEHGGSTYK